ncbi:hypothetical protein [Nonomuraea turcica]|uniref:hypothetical protein n=1 Tax=Nonomuraea sp. G32 TaxID=3067274 RepID=UPI00273B0B3F|nr:hypothetical protein [Nonomuraea sp. G32]MDP4510305.1 hypothetical protein [Nonomuraea sp. G32]
MSDLHEAFFDKTTTTMRRASLAQLKDFAALCQQVHADPGADVMDAVLGDEDPSGPTPQE